MIESLNCSRYEQLIVLNPNLTLINTLPSLFDHSGSTVFQLTSAQSYRYGSSFSDPVSFIDFLFNSLLPNKLDFHPKIRSLIDPAGILGRNWYVGFQVYLDQLLVKLPQTFSLSFNFSLLGCGFFYAITSYKDSLFILICISVNSNTSFIYFIVSAFCCEMRKDYISLYDVETI